MDRESYIITYTNAEEVADWCGGRSVVQHDALDHEATITGVNVPTRDNVQRASVGDMVIRNHDGSFSILKE